ncbi:G-protein coupled receptor Mth2 isoform X2 [Aethina tumida]|uniref:G-protein coupled receptor Mth2 isoform X2 n=1 Tax=Aethina tumida TaxID=116153 RepID=UPI00096AE2FC|nr:G-protein coupled receptor Mth2 isoform X2 [Aethina tumida]
MRFITIILIYLITTVCAQIQGKKCCATGPNELYESSCKNGDSVDIVCDASVIEFTVEELGSVTIDAEGNLASDAFDEAFSIQHYCALETNGTKSYLLCYTEDSIHSVSLTINEITCFISIFFIILTVTIYCTVPDLLDLQGICMVHSITNLAIGYFMLICINLIYMSGELCTIAGYTMYMAMMCAFFWLNNLSFHIWRTTVNPSCIIFKRNVNWKLVFYIYGYGGPILMLFLILIIHNGGHSRTHELHPGVGEAQCWFKSVTTTMLYFGLPIGTILTVNLVLYIWTAIVLWRQLRNVDEKETKVLQYRAKMCAKLFIVMGLTWFLELVSTFVESRTSKYTVYFIISDIVNGLTGLSIFLITVVFRKKVIRGLANKQLCCRYKLPADWKRARDSEIEHLQQSEEEHSLQLQT